MSVEFASQLFDTERHRLRAIAQSWLTGDGLNDPATIHRWLDTLEPEQFANEVLEAWFGLEEHDDTRPELDELIETFRELAVDRQWLEDQP